MSDYEQWVEAAGGDERLARIMARDLPPPLTVLDLFLLHGLVDLALKYPDMPASARAAGERILRDFEQLLEAAGVPRPPQGWRVGVPENGANPPPEGP